MDKETPITKYLATLERRQAQRERFLFGSPSPGVSPSPIRNPINIRQQLRFDDETFLQPHHDNSVMHPLSPEPSSLVPKKTIDMSSIATPTPTKTFNLFNSRTTNESSNSLFSSNNSYKRKRYSFEERDEDDENIKKISELQRLLRQTNGELVESRSISAKLERQKMELRTHHEEKALEFERCMSEMKIKTRDAVEKAEELQTEHNNYKKKIEELKEQLLKQATQHSEQSLALESKMSKLQSENTELKQKYEEDKMKQLDSIKKMSTDLDDSERGAEKWVIDCQILKDQLTLKETQLAKYFEELKEAQSIVFKYNSMKEKMDEMNSSESQSHLLQQEVKKFENLYVKQQNENNRITQMLTKLSNENNYMKTSMRKERLLEEQITSLQNEVKLLRDLLNTKAGVEAERDSYKEKLLDWTTVAAKVNSEYTSPQIFEEYISRTQNELFEMKHENTSLKCTNETITRNASKLQLELTSAKSQEKLLQDENRKLTTEVKQISRRLLLLTKDRDGLKSLKDSYEQELEGIISVALKDRISQLEVLVVEYENMIKDDPSIRKSCGECDNRRTLVTELRAELERLKNAKDSTDLADVTMGVDDGNTTGIKIVAFGLNPSTLSIEARIKELSNENERLKEKIQQLEEQSMVGVSDVLVTEEKKKLEEQIRTLERRHQILTEAYDYETQQLTAALSKLSGYHVTLVRGPPSQFRVRSVYSESAEDEFVFQEAAGGDMMLMETPILDHFRDDIERFLIREGSIPAFLASITITFSQGQAQPSDASQLPSSQQSNPDSIEAVTINPQRMVEVEVERQGQSDNEDEEVEEEQEPEEEEENDDEHEMPYSEDDVDEEEEAEHSESEGEGDNEGDNDIVCIDSD